VTVPSTIDRAAVLALIDEWFAQGGDLLARICAMSRLRQAVVDLPEAGGSCADVATRRAERRGPLVRGIKVTDQRTGQVLSDTLGIIYCDPMYLSYDGGTGVRPETGRDEEVRWSLGLGCWVVTRRGCYEVEMLDLDQNLIIYR